MAVNYLPAGYSDFEDDEDDYYYYGAGKKQEVRKLERPQIEIFKEKIIAHLLANDVNALRDELDNGSFKGFDIDSVVSNQWNLLFHACSEGKYEIVKFLIEERGVNINGHVDYESPLIVACKSSADSEEIYKIVKLLMKETTNINSTNRTGQTSIMLACYKGHLKTVELLMSKGVSIDAIDNHGYNALFHAIDGNRVEIAKILIEAGIDLFVVEKYGNTAKTFAESENREMILKLFPPEEYRYEIPTDYLSYSKFETVIPNTLGSNEVPPYFSDLNTMLHGMACEKLAPNFAQAKISLEEFLTMSDARMMEIGIEMPYHRAAIRLGLFKFYNAKWTKKSLYVPVNLKSHVSSLDLVYVLSNMLRQLIVMKTQLIYYQRLNLNIDRDNAQRFLKLDYIHAFQAHLQELEMQMKKVKPAERPLLIQKELPKKLNKKNVLTAVGISCAFLSILAFNFFFKK